MRRGMGFSLRRLILLNLLGHKLGMDRGGLAMREETEREGRSGIWWDKSFGYVIELYVCVR
jgi:hypothetical protein